MTVTELNSPEGVLLDVLERCADLEESLAGEIRRLFREFWLFGGKVPAPAMPCREEFESWAKACGAGDRRRGFPAPLFPRAEGDAPQPLWTVAQGKMVPSPAGRVWRGEASIWEDVAADEEWWARSTEAVSTWLELHRFAARPPTLAEVRSGEWQVPSWLPLEEGEAEILAGDDPETGLPMVVADWLGRLIHGPKADYARAYCAHRLFSEPEPADPGTPWAEKARRRAEVVLRAVAS